MATLADSLVSSTSRRLRLRVRPDLSARQQLYHGELYWVVKEPVGLNYFRFHEEEFAILQMLDGDTSLEEIKDRFEEEFTPQKITYQDLQQFVGMLHRSGLVISEAAGQGRQLKKRRDEKKRKQLLGKFTNIFAIRFRGVDPERFLNWLYQYTFWLFHPALVFLSLAVIIGAGLLILVQFDVFRSRLPGFHEFFGPHNWIFLGVTMGAVKILHEFGHGLSCKHFRGECHEIGLMFLVFTPCLYCNVSDSWMLPNKWHRVMIGAAGMYIELTMASIATFLWWFSEPGVLLNQLCLSVMFICSVSTLIFNGNPLLRFDGYYIMMDIAEIPNLRQKATEILKRFMVGLCLGLEQPENPFLPQKNHFFFGFYTIAAVIYRWVIVLSICMFLNKVLEPYGLQVIGRLLAAVGFFGLVVQPLWKLGKFFYIPGRMHKVKKPRLIASLAVVVVVIAAVIFVPLPHTVWCTFEIGPRDAAALYVDVPGRLEEIHAKEGEHVVPDDPVVTLSNPEVELAVIRLEGELERTKTQLRGLRRESFRDSGQASLKVKQVRERQTTINEQLAEKRKELADLNILSPVSGVIIPAPPPPEQRDEGRLPRWSGSPLAPKNKGATFAESQLICRIGDPDYLEALLVVDQADIELLDEARQDDKQPRAILQLDAFPGETLTSKVIEVAKVELQDAPARLSSKVGGELNTQTDSTGDLRPASTSYQARVPLDDQGRLQGLLCTGMRGKAKVATRSQSLGKRLSRYISRTFHFEL